MHKLGHCSSRLGRPLRSVGSLEGAARDCDPEMFSAISVRRVAKADETGPAIMIISSVS